MLSSCKLKLNSEEEKMKDKITEAERILLKMHANTLDFAEGLTSKEGFLARESEYLTRLSALITEIRTMLNARELKEKIKD